MTAKRILFTIGLVAAPVWVFWMLFSIKRDPHAFNGIGYTIVGVVLMALFVTGVAYAVGRYSHFREAHVEGDVLVAPWLYGTTRVNLRQARVRELRPNRTLRASQAPRVREFDVSDGTSTAHLHVMPREFDNPFVQWMANASAHQEQGRSGVNRSVYLAALLIALAGFAGYLLG